MSSTPVTFAIPPWARRRAESIGSLQSNPAASTRRRRSRSSSRIPQGQSSQQQPSHGGDSKLSSSITSGGHREPTRSFINPAHRDNLALVSTAQYARSVREETAELATYQLADKSDTRNPSFLDRNRSLSFHTTLSSDVDTEDTEFRPATIAGGAVGGTGRIIEAAQPERGYQNDENHTWRDEADLSADEGPSLLTRALKRSPPQHVRLSEEENILRDNDNVFSDEEDGDEALEDISHPTIVENCHIGTADDFGDSSLSDRLATETTPLLEEPSELANSRPRLSYDPESQKNHRRHGFLRIFDWMLKQPSETDGSGGRRTGRVYRAITNLKCCDRKTFWENAVVAPVACLPAVIVGLLLNILDALSYGMILFPLGSPVFAHLGSAGISIFYVSTIVSQLVFSSGSIFKGGIGSELIEVVPFFHNMALTITDIVGEDRPDAVIATTITSYALSSVVTGLVFYCMGRFRFGYIVGFIPRHILIGCIGGVGWFLVATGFEVTARIEGSLNYDIDTLHKLVQRDTIPLWGTPLALSIVLFWSQKRIPNKYFLPLFIIAIPFLFYFIVAVAGSFNQSRLRSHGWVFEGPPAGEPWWFFYTLYKFDQVHWGAIARCVPAMFALTFFGILHVPINVPALALNIGEDHADLNHELKLHGFSNMLSGALGSIQNYLVYANTLFFMRSGGDSRLAGFELAAFTFCVMLVGPKTIGFIPIMMVGCLIFDLGFELLVEAVWQPRKKLKRAEYVTVIAIVLIMGTYDFVVGIGVGILLAFVSLIIQTSQVSAIRAAYSGDIVNSTVRRNPSQQNYLRIVGCQICIIKLEGYLFFGTIVGVEDKIRELISDDSFHRQPIRYLILDLRHVTGLDYSAGEAFNTISRLLDGKGIQLVVSGVDAESELGHDLRAVGLGEDDIEVVFLPEINTALELCENELLKTLYASQEAHLGEGMKAGPTSGANVAIATTGSSSRRHLLIDEAGAGPSLDMLASSPRRNHLQAAARELLDNTEDRRRSRWQNFSDPLRLMLQIFQDVSDKDVDFWFRAGRYFQRLEYVAGDMLFSAGAVAEGFFLLEKGIVRAEYSLAHGQCYHESIVAGTTCGELPFFSETARTATAYADMDCTVWVLTREAWQRLQKEHPDVASERLRVSLKLTAERMSTVPSSTMLMAD